MVPNAKVGIPTYTHTKSRICRTRLSDYYVTIRITLGILWLYLCAPPEPWALLGRVRGRGAAVGARFVFSRQLAGEGRRDLSVTSYRPGHCTAYRDRHPTVSGTQLKKEFLAYCNTMVCIPTVVERVISLVPAPSHRLRWLHPPPPLRRPSSLPIWSRRQLASVHFRR